MIIIMTSYFDGTLHKYVVDIVIPRPYTSIKGPLVMRVGTYDTMAEAKIACEVAVHMRNEITKIYKEEKKTKNNTFSGDVESVIQWIHSKPIENENTK